MRRPVLIVLAGFGVLTAFGVGTGFLLRAAVGRGPTALDERVLHWFVDRRGPGLTDAVRAIQFLGRTEFMFVIVALAGVLLVSSQRRVGLVLVVACVGAETFVDVIKPVVGRRRPPVHLWLEHTGRGAYPSGHALISTVVTMSVVAAIGALTGRRIPAWLWWVAGVVPLAVGLGRLYLGVHWLTDVLGGWLIGGLWIALLVRVVLPTPIPGSSTTESPITGAAGVDGRLTP